MMVCCYRTLEHEQKFIPYDEIFSPVPMEVELCLSSPLPQYSNQFKHVLPTTLRSVSSQHYGPIFVGELLHSFYKTLLVHQNDRPIWRLTFDQDLKDSTSSQSLGIHVYNDPKLLKLQQQILEQQRQEKMRLQRQRDFEEGNIHNDDTDSQGDDDHPHPNVEAGAETANETYLYMDNEETSGLASNAFVYHHGDELFVELHIFSRKKMTLLPEQYDALAKGDQANLILSHYISMATQSVDIRVLNKITLNDLVVILQPNFTEIFEGKEMNKEYITSYTSKDFYQLITNWITLDYFNSYLHLSVLRARYLILTKLSIINNFNIRMEIYEERFGELLICIFGLPHDDELTSLKINANTYSILTGYNYTPSKAIYRKNLHYLRIQRPHIFKLLSNCDPQLEKDKLEAFDTLAMAYLFSDRMQIRPSVLWRSFLNFHSFLPCTIRPNLEIGVRYKQGPGRLVGREVLNLTAMFIQPNDQGQGSDDLSLPTIHVLLSIYEVNSPSSTHELRIVLYHFYNGQSVEFRVSAMERLLLFDDSSSVMDQLVSKV